MPFTPTTAVYLCSVPLEKDQKNQLDFADATAQHLYFSNNIKKSYTSFTYQRKDSVLRVPAEFDTLYDCNYVMYQNADFGTKWFYCFVDHMEYVNPNCTAIYLKTDVFQTWLFTWILKSSFVAREHVADDTPLIHTLPENIETGELQAQKIISATVDLDSTTPTRFNLNYMCVVCMSEEFTYGGQAYGGAWGTFFGGLPNMCNYYAMDSTALGRFFSEIDHNGQADAVVAVYCLAKNAVYTSAWFMIDSYQIYSVSDLTSPLSAVDVPTYVSQNKMFSGYAPKNKKMLCYPYNYITLTNNNGSSVDLRLENFTNSDKGTLVHFLTDYAPSINSSLYVYPKDYLQSSTGIPTYFSQKSYDYGVEYNAFPQIAWVSDIYKNYLALNANSIEMQKISWGINAAQIVMQAGASPAAAANSAIGLGTNIMSYYSQQADREKRPLNVHGQPTGNVQMKSGSAGIFAVCKSLKTEYNAVVDQYFDFYGYNVSTVKVPQFNSRPAWNYIETREINIDGGIPQDDMQEIKSIFNRGLTVWHNPSHFLDYTQSNVPTP